MSMSSAELLAILADLKTNRRISSEIAEVIEPLQGKSFALELVFSSSARTFGNRFDPAYDNGYTVTCRTADADIEVSVMFDPKDNPVVEARETDEDFKAQVTLLDYDSLYQRAILGQFIEKPESLDEEQAEEKGDLDTAEEVEFHKEEPVVEDEEPAEIPEENKEEGPETTHTGERTFPSKDSGDSTERKSGALNVVLAAGGIAAALAAAWGWTNEFTFLASDFERWVFWSILTFPLALGLPCLANRARKTLLITICAFAFDVAGTYFSTYDSADPAAGGAEELVMEQDEIQVGATYMEEVVVEEFPGETYYNIALVLQAAALLGLAGSVATKRLGFLSMVAALGFACYTILFLKENELVWLQEESFWLNPSFLFLVAITACCASTMLGAMKPAEQGSGSQ